MTGLLVLGRTEPDDLVTISRTAALTPPSDIGLKAGERLTSTTCSRD